MLHDPHQDRSIRCQGCQGRHRSSEGRP
jgi:hypothetical protein